MKQYKLPTPIEAKSEHLLFESGKRKKIYSFIAIRSDGFKKLIGFDHTGEYDVNALLEFIGDKEEHTIQLLDQVQQLNEDGYVEKLEEEINEWNKEESLWKYK